MTPDLRGRLETRLVVSGALAPLAVAATAWCFGLGGTPYAAALFAAYGLGAGLLAEPLYALAQGLRREGDWPPAHVVYGLVLETGALVALMRADRLPGLPACLEIGTDLALRRFVCAEPSLSDAEALALLAVIVVVTRLAHGVILPVLLPRWRLSAGRILPRRRRR